MMIMYRFGWTLLCCVFVLALGMAQQIPLSSRAHVLIRVDQADGPDQTIVTDSHVSQSMTYYVDRLTGNDHHDGTSPFRAWRHLAKLESYPFNPGDHILLANGRVWHELLRTRPSGIAGAPIVISHYGVGERPTIDAADPIVGWTNLGKGVYSAPSSQTITKVFMDSTYRESEPLSPVDSIERVSATPASSYSDGKHIWVHLQDGSDPVTHTIEASGARPYGVDLNQQSYIVLDGLRVIRAAKAGIIAADPIATGHNVTIKDCVLFNNGDTIGDPSLGGQVGGSILVLPGYKQQSLSGWVIRNNFVGRSDFTDSVLNWAKAAIQVSGTVSAQITSNRVTAVHGAAIQVTNWFNSSCSQALVADNEIMNSESNISEGGCPHSKFIGNTIHDSRGNGIELGDGLQLGENGDFSYLGFNYIANISPAYDYKMYNGIDVNYAAHGTAVGNVIRKVASACMTLEGDAAPSSDWDIVGNEFDASQGAAYDGAQLGGAIRTYPFYTRDTSLAGGIHLASNNFVFNSKTPYIKWGASSASDETHDLTEAQFKALEPQAESPALFTSSGCKGTAGPICSGQEALGGMLGDKDQQLSGSIFSRVAAIISSKSGLSSMSAGHISEGASGDASCLILKPDKDRGDISEPMDEIWLLRTFEGAGYNRVQNPGSTLKCQSTTESRRDGYYLSITDGADQRPKWYFNVCLSGMCSAIDTGTDSERGWVKAEVKRINSTTVGVSINNGGFSCISNSKGSQPGCAYTSQFE